jgi:hypothetical protein
MLSSFLGKRSIEDIEGGRVATTINMFGRKTLLQ